MFEAVLTVCLSLSAGPCRDQLLPGYEAETATECQQALARRPPELTGSLERKGAPVCRAVGRQLPFTEVASGVFVHMGAIAEPRAENGGDVANLGFVIGDASVAVIDSGSARWIGEAVWRAVRARTSKPVSHVILTHMHPDHVLGASVLVEGGAEVVGHAGLRRALADRQANYIESLSVLIPPDSFLGTQAAPVDITIADKGSIDLGGRVLALRAWPAAHTGSDLTVFDSATGTLFAGDLVFDRHTPALDGSLPGWRSVLSDLSMQDIVRVIPGHGGPVLDWPEGIENLNRYLKVLADDTRAAIDSGMRIGDAVDVIAQSEAAHWQLFDAYNKRNATVAFTELEWE